VLRVACCVLRVACCVLRVACCVLRVAYCFQQSLVGEIHTCFPFVFTCTIAEKKKKISKCEIKCSCVVPEKISSPLQALVDKKRKKKRKKN
jgi:hypothetical protein